MAAMLHIYANLFRRPMVPDQSSFFAKQQWRLRLSIVALLAICLLGWAPAELVQVQGITYTQSLYWQYSAWPVGGIVVLALLILVYAQWRSGRWLRQLAWYTALVVVLFGGMRIWQLWQSRPFAQPAWGLYTVVVLGLVLLLLNTKGRDTVTPMDAKRQ